MADALQDRGDHKGHRIWMKVADCIDRRQQAAGEPAY